LIILLLCRDATVQYAWSVHEPLARSEGLTAATIEAIRARRRPDFERDDERLIYDLVTELLATKALSAPTFDRAKAAFGLDGVIEAVSCAGFYGMIGLVLNAAPLWISRYMLDLRVPEVSLLAQEAADFASANVIGTLLAMVFRWWAFRRYVFPDQNVRTSLRWKSYVRMAQPLPPASPIPVSRNCSSQRANEPYARETAVCMRQASRPPSPRSSMITP